MIEYPPDFISAKDVEKVRPWIEGALRYSFGTHTFEDVMQDVVENRASLWVFDRSAVVTQTVQYPRLKVLTFWLAGGKMADMLSHHQGIVEWGLADGVERFSILGRGGWQRVMLQFGYKPMHYIMSKDT